MSDTMFTSRSAATRGMVFLPLVLWADSTWRSRRSSLGNEGADVLRELLAVDRGVGGEHLAYPREGGGGFRGGTAAFPSYQHGDVPTDRLRRSEHV